VEREALAEFLWPERPPEQARSNVRVALHRLHQQLEPYLRVTRQSIALDTRAGVRLDSAQFEADLAAGQIAPATALYAGDFLADFYLDGSPAFEQWALLERERLHTLLLAEQIRSNDAAILSDWAGCRWRSSWPPAGCV
jgi:DNA-binding SARP family transcriptional activator